VPILHRIMTPLQHEEMSFRGNSVHYRASANLTETTGRRVMLDNSGLSVLWGSRTEVHEEVADLYATHRHSGRVARSLAGSRIMAHQLASRHTNIYRGARDVAQRVGLRGREREGGDIVAEFSLDDESLGSGNEDNRSLGSAETWLTASPLNQRIIDPMRVVEKRECALDSAPEAAPASDGVAVSDDAVRFASQVAKLLTKGTAEEETIYGLQFGQWVRMKRHASGMSIETLAKETGIDIKLVTLLESGLLSAPEIGAVREKVMATLGANPSEFLANPDLLNLDACSVDQEERCVSYFEAWEEG
jgi:transcriptional regulator with XRE-family HTH domain